MHNHLRTSYILFRATISSYSWLQTWAAGIAQLALEPALTTVLFVFLSNYTNESFLPNALAAASMACSLKTTSITVNMFSQDRYEGTLPYLAISSGRLAGVIALRIIISGLLGIIGGISSFFTIIILNPSSASTSIFCNFIVILICCVLSATATGYLIHSLSLFSMDEMLMQDVFLFILPIACGAVIPIWNLPSPLPYIFNLIPISSITSASRLIANGDIFSSFQLLIDSLLISLTWFILGFIIWRCGMRSQIRSGRIEALGL